MECKSGRKRDLAFFSDQKNQNSAHPLAMECESRRNGHRLLIIQKDKIRPDEAMPCSLGPEKMTFAITSWSVSGGRKRLRILSRLKKNKIILINKNMECESGRNRHRPLITRKDNKSYKTTSIVKVWSLGP